MLGRCYFLFPVLLFPIGALTATAQWIPENPALTFDKLSNGILIHMQTGAVRLEVCTDSMIHVTYASQWPPPTANRPELAIVKNGWETVPWDVQSDSKTISVITAKLKVAINRQDGILNYFDAAGKPLLAEGPKKMSAATVNGEDTFHSLDVFKVYGSDEAFYGLGQHQAGVFNMRGESVDLSQENTDIAIPFFVSTKGYGIYWNNTSSSRFNNRFIHYLYLTSQVADSIDYYFCYGPQLDKLVAAYRALTGDAPLFGKWAYGFWQCKNKYTSQAEILSIAQKYRDLKIPVDNIVQDWFWWTSTGEFKWNAKYPDPQAMLHQLHRENFHLMVSIWPFFYPGTATYEDMDKRGFFIEKAPSVSFHPKGMALYDAFNPAARDYYWKLVNDSLFKIGVDAWWMDTTEPETEGVEDNILLNHKVAIGSGARFANAYPLMTTGGIYEHQRAASDAKRVFILSRSAWAGNQRYAVTAWSGDVLSDFETFKRQIPAGLNFALAGVPYWTTDIGGFILGHPNDPRYRELFIRWFQYGAFCPIFRVHGTRAPNENELWSYGPEAQTILTDFDRLRYRLLPYIYSAAWQVTSAQSTIMRPLVMDFADDTRVRNIGDQFLFGSSLLVNPVTEEGATMRHLYLPKTKWIDFWTGETLNGGAYIDAPAPLSSMPLYVRAGSIVPLGPELQYTSEKPADPLELRIYPGADANYSLYEDEGDSYRYEKGVYATIALHWNDQAQTLSIGERQGSFPRMLERRTFQVVVVKAGNGIGIGPTSLPDQTVSYDGKALVLRR
jgi:alpha-D-xyloside xylohydrolase